MKHLLTSLFVTLSLAFSGAALAPLSAAVAVSPAPICQTTASDTDVCGEVKNGQSSNKNPVISVLKIVIDVIAVIIGIAAVIVLIVSGMRMITSQGDAQSVATARSTIIYALIALVVAALAPFLVGFVLNAIG